MKFSTKLFAGVCTISPGVPYWAILPPSIISTLSERVWLETAEKLRAVAARIPLIFVSNERDYSLEGYRVHTLDYLLKPVDADALDWCLNEIRTFLSEPAYIEIQAVLGQGQSSCQRILLDDFLYAETQNHRLIIHTLKGDVATRLSFSDLMALLPTKEKRNKGGIISPSLGSACSNISTLNL